MSRQPVQTIRLRLTCANPPPAIHAGQATRFGILDQSGMLTPGMHLPGGTLRFDIEVQVPLAAIPWPLVEAAGDGTLDATVAGDRGATVPLLVAWHAPSHGPIADDGTG